MFVSFCNKKLRNYINELKGDIADAKYIRQILVNQQEKRIKTLRVIYNKPFDYIGGDIMPSFSFADVKKCMADYIAKQIIKDNILQIKKI